MIGLDTNVLLRLYLADDASQGESARRLVETLSEARPGYVNVLTLVELIWTLRKRYAISRERILDIVSGLLESRDIVLEDEALVEIAVDRAAGLSGELPDLLIALRNGEAGCSVTMTFDRKAAQHIPGMELLT